MDSEHIEKLLEKYWDCQTSLEEERELRDFFRGGEVPEKLRDTASLFRYFDDEQSRKLVGDFDKKVKSKLSGSRPKGRVVKMLSWKQVARIAAGLVVVVAATFLIREEIRKSYPEEMQDSYTDPQLAYEETKKALMMISNTFGKAKRETGRIKIFNEAEQKIRGDLKEEKETKKESKI